MQGALDVVTQSLVRTFMFCKIDAIPVNNKNVVRIPVILKHKNAILLLINSFLSVTS